MNFPDVPFDENLFASNTMLKSYWERSTNERASAVIPDWPSEETKTATELEELRTETMEHWKEPEASFAADEPINGSVLDYSEPKVLEDRGALVKPKLSNAAELVFVCAFAAVLILVIFIMYSISKKCYGPMESRSRRT